MDVKSTPHPHHIWLGVAASRPLQQVWAVRGDRLHLPGRQEWTGDLLGVSDWLTFNVGQVSC